jgi:hypothetical protein
MTDAINQRTEEAAQRAGDQIREFGSRATGSTRAYSQLALDTYERAVRDYVEFERRAAEAAPVDWLGTAIGAHASIIEDMTNAYVRAVRSVMI